MPPLFLKIATLISFVSPVVAARNINLDPTSFRHQYTTNINKLYATSVVALSVFHSTLPVIAVDREFINDDRYVKSMFNLPPAEAFYPNYFEGKWKVKFQFNKADFSNQFQVKELANDLNLAGFRKYSIMAVPDIGKDFETTLSFINRDGKIVEDLVCNTRAIFLDSLLSTVQTIVYDPVANPNRVGVQYSDSKGSGKLEIFCNSRTTAYDSKTGHFNSLTQYRQSSVRRTLDSQQASSQIFGDYLIELDVHSAAVEGRPDVRNSNKIIGSFRLLSYFQPQDPLFFRRADRPVAIFDYNITYDRI